MVEGKFPKVDGDVLFASETNHFEKTYKIKQIYTGTGFNSAANNSIVVQSHELDAITSANLSSANYLIIKITGTSLITLASKPASTGLKIQTKEVGGAYSDSMPYVYHLYSEDNYAETYDRSRQTNTLEYIHTLTAGEKANGVQVKIFSISYNGGIADTSFTNIQTQLILGV